MECVALAGGMSTAVYLSCHLPISLHFGWMTAAAAVNLNNFVAVAAPAPHKQLSIAFASVYAAAALGAPFQSFPFPLSLHPLPERHVPVSWHAVIGREDDCSQSVPGTGCTLFFGLDWNVLTGPRASI